MPLDWDLIQVHLESYINDGEMYTLKEALQKVYHEMDMSPRNIEEFLFGLASSTSIRKKMHELGIKIKSKGGANFVKHRDISFLDYLCSTRKGLAKEYSVSEGYIYRYAKAMGWPVRRRRK